MKYTRKSKVLNTQNQARPDVALYQPEVERHVTRLVHRRDPDHRVPGTHLTMDAFHDYQLLGRRLQAQAMASAITAVLRGLVWPFRKLAAASARASREAAAIRQLSALDDYLLADMGISRGQIRSAVAGLLQAEATAQAERSTAVEPQPTELPKELPREPRAPCHDAETKAAA